MAGIRKRPEGGMLDFDCRLWGEEKDYILIPILRYQFTT